MAGPAGAQEGLRCDALDPGVYRAVCECGNVPIAIKRLDCYDAASLAIIQERLLVQMAMRRLMLQPGGVEAMRHLLRELDN